MPSRTRLGGHGEGDRAPVGHLLEFVDGLMELLKAKVWTQWPLNEMRKDVDRLECASTNASASIGSAPDLTPEKLYYTLRATVLYLRPRLPFEGCIEVVQPADPELLVPLNRALFSWAIENRSVMLWMPWKDKGRSPLNWCPMVPTYIDVTDNGKGIPGPTAYGVPARLHHQETRMGIRSSIGANASLNNTTAVISW
ncbi:MAG: hypothetical protein IPO87_13850 [Flavobacteriales bacterium]|nr:hypothetical protein [Flavobacteriales bacterium]